MKREILASTAQKRGISLDPRTKLALLVSIAVFVLGGSYAGAMQWVMIALSAVPLLLFLAAGRFRGAFLYVLIFGVSLWLEMVALARLEGLANFLAVTIVGIFLRFTPSLAMGYIAMSTTTVSEFLAAMARLHLPQQVAIPLAVIFRFFPDDRRGMARHRGRHAHAWDPAWWGQSGCDVRIPPCADDDQRRKDWRGAFTSGAHPRPRCAGETHQPRGAWLRRLGRVLSCALRGCVVGAQGWVWLH